MTKIYGLDSFGEGLPSFEEFTSGESNKQQLKKIMKFMPEIIENELTEKQKLCVDLYYFKGMTLEEIASAYSVNPATVSRHLKRARTRIGKLLKYAIDSDT